MASEGVGLPSVPKPVAVSNNIPDQWKTKFLVERIAPDAILPVKESDATAGYDLFSLLTYTIPAWGQAEVKTGIKVSLPKGFYGRVASRSGNAIRHRLEVGAGVIDNDYQGEIIVVVHNFSDADFNITQGFKIAQLILEPYATYPIEQVRSIVSLVGESERGEKGFGSSDAVKK